MKGQGYTANIFQILGKIFLAEYMAVFLSEGVFPGKVGWKIIVDECVVNLN